MSTRTLTGHRVNGLNEAIKITVMDDPGPGGANHQYEIRIEPPDLSQGVMVHYLHFQNGPIQESGVNGLSNEALLEVLIDRMRGFQYARKPDGSFDESVRGKYACRENALALTYLEEAQMWLQKRTRDRLARGVEGTHKV